MTVTFNRVIIRDLLLVFMKGDDDTLVIDHGTVHLLQCLVCFIHMCITHKTITFGFGSDVVLHDSGGDDFTIDAESLEQVITSHVWIQVLYIQIRIVNHGHDIAVMRTCVRFSCIEVNIRGRKLFLPVGQTCALLVSVLFLTYLPY